MRYAIVAALLVAGCAAPERSWIDTANTGQEEQRNRECKVEMWKRGIVWNQGMHWLDYCNCASGARGGQMCRVR